MFLYLAKGQLISKANCQAVNSSKKQMNVFVCTTMRRVFVCFLEEIEDSKKAFKNYLTYIRRQFWQIFDLSPLPIADVVYGQPPKLLTR